MLASLVDPIDVATEAFKTLNAVVAAQLRPALRILSESARKRFLARRPLSRLETIASRATAVERLLATMSTENAIELAPDDRWRNEMRLEITALCQQLQVPSLTAASLEGRWTLLMDIWFKVDDRSKLRNTEVPIPHLQHDGSTVHVMAIDFAKTAVKQYRQQRSRRATSVYTRSPRPEGIVRCVCCPG